MTLLSNDLRKQDGHCPNEECLAPGEHSTVKNMGTLPTSTMQSKASYFTRANVLSCKKSKLLEPSIVLFLLTLKTAQEMLIFSMQLNTY